MKKMALFVALAALLVNAPRLMLIYLRVDGLALPASVEGAMLATTGIATGIVLTGGGMYIAHVLAATPAGGGLRSFLAVCWLLLLAFSVVLISPALVAGIRETGMVNVLTTPQWQWIWSVIAVAAVEILAAGAMVAHALISAPGAVSKRKPGLLAAVADAAGRRLLATLEAGTTATAEASTTATAEASTSYDCLYCDFSGATYQALNAHKRFCAGRRDGREHERHLA